MLVELAYLQHATPSTALATLSALGLILSNLKLFY